jgi:hypothetical protein
MSQKSTQGVGLITQGGNNTTPVTAAQIQAGPVIIKSQPGILCFVIVTTALTAGQSINIYDNASTGAGTIIGKTAAGAAAGGGALAYNFPANLGITVGQNASLTSGAITVSWF